MKGLLESFKCIYCKLILQSPINLPCGHTICQKHVADRNSHLFSCLSCDKVHSVPDDGFPLNHSLVFLANMNFVDYNNALNACNSLKSTINEMKLSKIEQKSQFEREVRELKCGICSKRDELIEEITCKSEEMINEIEIYENECQNSLETMSNKIEMVENKVVEENNVKLDDWLTQFLNSQTTSHTNLVKILKNCELERVKLSELFEKAKGYLLQLDNYKTNCDILGYFKNFAETHRFLNILIKFGFM
jgi:hypothetical protein